jgi:DNA-binding MarR family transcriptional regulator
MGQPLTEQNPTLRADAERLADVLSVLQRCFLLRLSQDLARGNVSFPQYLLLGFLVQQEQLTMTEIASKMGHTTAAATGLVDRLEKLGLVLRVHAQEDRRKVFVRPTPEGCALVASVRSDMVENLMRMMSHLDLGEQKAWVRIYEKIFDFCQNP